MKRIVIVGGGISGLIASWVFTQCRGLDVVVVEPGKPGGDFMAGGLKYIHRTDEMEELLRDLGVQYTQYSVQGGILLHDKVEPHPGCFRGMDKERALRIQHDHYRKTRKLEPDAFAARSMNDPEANGPRRALRCDMARVLRELIQRAPIEKAGVTRIEPHRVITATGTGESSLSYDYLLTTLPLWVNKRISWFGEELPDGMAVKLNLVMVEPPQKGDDYAQWDYVYTPYTPENLIHRISPRDGGYTLEFNGVWGDGDALIQDRITSELNFLFKDGWALAGVVKNLNGHLIPLTTKPNWPFNVRPVGRFAQWDPRATSDAVLGTCLKLAAEWGFKVNRESLPPPADA
jgi:glycine/D-amino acid oxidase-like deaminating enzyme